MESNNRIISIIYHIKVELKLLEINEDSGFFDYIDKDSTQVQDFVEESIHDRNYAVEIITISTEETNGT